jgi:hypothetical protein
VVCETDVTTGEVMRRCVQSDFSNFNETSRNFVSSQPTSSAMSSHAGTVTNLRGDRETQTFATEETTHGNGQTTTRLSYFSRETGPGYENIVANFNPTNRFEPGNLSGTNGNVSWSDSIGTGSIVAQGANLNFVTGTVGGKNALNVNPSLSTDYSRFVNVSFNRTYSGTDSFTFVMVSADFYSSGLSRGIFWLDSASNPNYPNFLASTINPIWNASATNGYFVVRHPNMPSDYLPYTPANTWNFADMGTSANPSVYVLRYNHVGTELKIWINGVADGVALTNSSTNLDVLSIESFMMGRGEGGSQGIGGGKIAEIMMFDRALDDTEVANLSQDLLVEYGTRTSRAARTTEMSYLVTTNTSKTLRGDQRVDLNLTDLKGTGDAPIGQYVEEIGTRSDSSQLNVQANLHMESMGINIARLDAGLVQSLQTRMNRLAKEGRLRSSQYCPLDEIVNDLCDRIALVQSRKHKGDTKSDSE